jgi:hypothetical protein
MTPAITALLEIMSRHDVPIRRRIEAAEGLLAFEAPNNAIEQAKMFLSSVFEDTEQHVDDRLDALKLMRKAESPKVRQPTVSARDESALKEQAREIAIGRRRAALMSAGLWPPPPDSGWADDLLSPDYNPPIPPPSQMSIAEAVRCGRLRAEARQRQESECNDRKDHQP